jgi:hypothetical protein
MVHVKPSSAEARVLRDTNDYHEEFHRSTHWLPRGPSGMRTAAEMVHMARALSEAAG